MTMKCTDWNEITIYWDDLAGWVFRAREIKDDRIVAEESHAVGVSLDSYIDDAVDEACHQLGVDLDHNEFAQEPLCWEWAEAN